MLINISQTIHELYMLYEQQQRLTVIFKCTREIIFKMFLSVI